MKKYLGLLSLVCLSMALTGCGGPKEASSAVQDADAAKIAEYQEALKAEEAAGNAAPPTE